MICKVKIGGGYILGAVPESFNRCPLKWLHMVNGNLVNYDDYFIDDVMILNPIAFRNNFESILNACKFIYDNGYTYLEQDVLNYLFSKAYLKLPLKFDTIVRNMRSFFEEQRIEKAIYHFAGIKPDLNTDDIYNRLYFEYFLKTPWATIDMFGNISKNCKRQFDFIKEQFLNYTNVLGGRRRVFLIRGTDIENMKKIFEIRDDEPIINESDPEALAKFFETTDELKGRKLIYVVNGDYLKIRNELRQRKLAEGKDFFNARIVLLPEQGGALNFDPNALLREI